MILTFLVLSVILNIVFLVPLIFTRKLKVKPVEQQTLYVSMFFQELLNKPPEFLDSIYFKRIYNYMNELRPHEVVGVISHNITDSRSKNHEIINETIFNFEKYLKEYWKDKYDNEYKCLPDAYLDKFTVISK